ncbi:Modification methylase HhaI [Roseovarius sp. AK1035]|jgi:DNA (cytosine-5)-methyltransferase 1|uniref:DNA cytosine methyltransferase n=1 Tax=Roseovarius sp. TM1035 TaxID=391613 RepID=UPI000DCABFFB|nr:DNA cytosine methyltransferase [Roseovarius sp. TM1035]AWZ22354.1 Modification methylase HhaI [Roseovarius sp. AK1035]
MDHTPRYAEFFCGGGMVRAALQENWHCVLANDIDEMKCRVYRENWSGTGLFEGDVASLDPEFLKQDIDLYWASSPCQDFSLAGKGLGLEGARSGVFKPWFEKVRAAVKAGFAPRVIAFENVTGLMSRRAGKDLDHVLRSFISLGYKVGALEIDASHFVPQSRPRLFIIAVRRDIDATTLCQPQARGLFCSPRLVRFHGACSRVIQKNWMWFRVPSPTTSPQSLENVLDTDPDTPWFSDEHVASLLSMMSSPSLGRIEAAKATNRTVVGTLYKRGRPDAAGQVRQRAEVRFDGIAGCLRTPAGGSSRQTILIVHGDKIEARLLSRLEVSRLMGLPATYRMPARYNDAYRLAGDGVVVPIVRYLDEHIFQPILLKRLVEREVA